MTLHQTVETAKKAGIGSVFGIIGIIILVILIRVGLAMKDSIFPAKIDPPSAAYDKLPPILFPKNTAAGNFTYTLNTNSGTVPVLPDRLTIFPIVHNSPNFLNLDKVKNKVKSLGFIASDGSVLPETALGGSLYEWDESDQTDLKRKITFNIVTFDFNMTSAFLASNTVLNALYLSNEQSAISTVQDFLSTVQLTPADIDITKTNNPQPDVHYITYPQLFSIDLLTGQLSPTTSLSKAQVIRVDLYQKDVEYDLNTGKSENSLAVTSHVKIPILYPNPPFSTMYFYVVSGTNDALVGQANFTHQAFDMTNINATYKIKTADQAFAELKNGQAYIASYYGKDKNILINNIYLGYYIGQDAQDYLMPIVVFEGDNGFFAYVSAVSNEWIK